jgi:O-antigen/teichoic acid export membrane protein
VLRIGRLIGMVRRFRGVNWALADQAVISLCNFISIYLLARHMAIGDFGVFTLAFTGLMIAVGAQNALISKPHNVVAAKLDTTDYTEFTSALALVQVIVASAVMAVAVAAGLVLTVGFDLAGGWTVIVLGFIVLPWLMQEFVRRTFYTRSHSRSAFVNDTVCYGLQLVGIAALVATSSVSTVNALFVMGASSLVAALLGAWQLRQVVTLDRGAYASAHVTAVWRRTWAFGRWLTAREVVVWFSGHGHTWLLAGMLGVEALGMYRAAYHIVNVLNPITMAVGSYAPSRARVVLESGGPSALAAWSRRATALAGTLYAVVALGVAALSGEFLTLFYPERFAEFRPLLQWVIILSALETLIRKFTLFPGIVLLVMERVRILFLLNLLTMVVLLVALVALIGSFGILGAPLAKLVAGSLSLVLLGVRARSLLAEPVEVPALAGGRE